MNTLNSTHLVQLLHLNDTAFPTGAFSHSYGLETCTQSGMIHDIASLQAYVQRRLFDGMLRFDLIFLRESLHAARQNNIDFVFDLDERLSAMMTVYELREASTQVGRRFLRAMLPIYGGKASNLYFEAVQQKRCSGHFAIAYGIALADLGIPATLALLSYLSSFVKGQAAAAVKLLNLGQTPIQAMITALQPIIQTCVDQSLTYALNDCQVFTPAMDIYAMQHEYLFRRLFIS
jgi:urease accessory protein